MRWPDAAEHPSRVGPPALALVATSPIDDLSG